MLIQVTDSIMTFNYKQLQTIIKPTEGLRGGETDKQRQRIIGFWTDFIKFYNLLDIWNKVLRKVFFI